MISLTPRAARIGPLYEAGQHVKEIAAAEGCCVDLVYRTLRAAGIPRRRKGPVHFKRGPVDTARAAEFKRRYLAGDTLQAIADDYGVSRERVRQVLRKIDVPTLGLRKEHCRQIRPLTAEQVNAARMYERGARRAEVLAAYPGLKYSRLHAAIQRLGIKTHPSGAWRILPDDADRTEAVAVLYQQGLSAVEITARLPWLRFPETVYRYLKKAGVKARGDTRQGTSRKCHSAAAIPESSLPIATP